MISLDVYHYTIQLTTLIRFELTASCVTGKRSNQLNYRANYCRISDAYPLYENSYMNFTPCSFDMHPIHLKFVCMNVDQTFQLCFMKYYIHIRVIKLFFTYILRFNTCLHFKGSTIRFN